MPGVPINGQAFVGPLILPGVLAAATLIVSDLSPLEAQLATDFTFNTDVVNPLLKLTVMLVVPWPLTNVIFAGNVQVYDVAFNTGSIE